MLCRQRSRNEKLRDMNNLQMNDIAIDIFGDVTDKVNRLGFISMNHYHTILDNHTDTISNPSNNAIRTLAHDIIACDLDYFSNGISNKTS